MLQFALRSKRFYPHEMKVFRLTFYSLDLNSCGFEQLATFLCSYVFANNDFGIGESG